MYTLFRAGWLSGRTSSFLTGGLIPQINPGGAAGRPTLWGARRPGACRAAGSVTEPPGSKGKREQVKKF